MDIISTRQQIIDEKRRKKLTVFIIDNQPIYRIGIHQVLKEDMQVVGESSLTINICGLIEALSPDIVTVDIGQPSLSGFGVARQIATRCPNTAVVIVSPDIDDDQLSTGLHGVYRHIGSRVNDQRRPDDNT